VLQDYFPILVLLGVVVAFVLVSLVLSELAGHSRRTRGKGTTYECGMDPVGNARGRFSVKFFVVAVLFILFDIESVFLIPWAVNLKLLSGEGYGVFLFVEMLAFIGVLALGLAYIWKKGGLEWD